uniref:Uncharacterized protein n=1 Tax=Rhizophora mucronata TaxID=61149 RepID=A0A2P2PM22_RHIMU
MMNMGGLATLYISTVEHNLTKFRTFL